MTADPFANMTSEDEEAKLDAAFGPLPSPADRYDIEAIVAKAGRYLAAAHHANLPAPRYISIGAGGISGAEPASDTSVNFQFSTASKVHAWADHFGGEVIYGKAGPGAELPGPTWHTVTVYAPAEVPGLAEHTEAACDAIKAATQ